MGLLIGFGDKKVVFKSGVKWKEHPVLIDYCTLRILKLCVMRDA